LTEGERSGTPAGATTGPADRQWGVAPAGGSEDEPEPPADAYAARQGPSDALGAFLVASAAGNASDASESRRGKQTVKVYLPAATVRQLDAMIGRSGIYPTHYTAVALMLGAAQLQRRLERLGLSDLRGGRPTM